MSSHAYPQTGAGPSSYYQHSPPPHHVYGNHSPSPRPNYQYSYPVPPPNLNSYQSPQFQQSPSRGNHSYYQHSPPSHYVYGNHSPGPRPNYQHSHPVPLPNSHQSLQFQPMPSTGNHNAGSGGASAPSHESVMSQAPYTSTYSQMGTISTSDTVSPLSSPPSSSHPSPPWQPVVNPVAQWAIWSRRPQDPSHAPGIIISPRARPPPDVVQQAIDLKTPPPSQPSSPSQSVNILSAVEESLVENTIGTTKEEDPQPFTISPPARPSQDIVEQAIVLKTPPPSHPSSPPRSVTILSAVEDSLAKATIGAAKEEENATQVDPPTPSVPEPRAAVPPQVPPTPVIVKKWADLLRPSTSSTSSSSTSPSSGSATRNTLPTSSVVGFSIPAGSPSSSNRTVPVSPSKKSELISLLTTGPSPNLTTAGTTTIRPRGIVNSGNMCYANSVLQVLVYCPPFQRLFAELGKVTSGSTSTPINGLNGTEKEMGMTPLVEATVEFLKEFMDEKKPKSKTKKLVHSRKGSIVVNGTVDGSGEVDWDACDSFLPTYMYDAMKLKKRFDHMRGGHQEDAEEFFGFYLETLEEELLSLLHAVSPPKLTKMTATVEEKEEAAPPEDDGWMEVGKRNRTIVTRTIKTTESPITRIFSGRFRTTVRAPGQKDSATVDDWNLLRLDIQRDHIHTVQDALSGLSQAQSVQLTQSTRPGVIIEGQQQSLIEVLPPILVLQMKRFEYDTTGVAKVGKQVRFGPELEIGHDLMVPAAKNAHPPKYKLFGALYHHGFSASGGHYTLDVLHPNRYPGSGNAKIREGWVRIDDELVSDVRHDDVFGAYERDDARCAYLLFYRRI